ncbi:hypothetical protein CKAH01_18470 [Colletotrichum kahawae]|uniref:Uncharacterized protein n=1 Tax=Colletotrichum kahawae TaxID=34407 RepID=A0AAD9Y6N4_COLKA|nr:hypothetical protein CKAH01_18470 [Colletotrichum kahawae]
MAQQSTDRAANTSLIHRDWRDWKRKTARTWKQWMGARERNGAITVITGAAIGWLELAEKSGSDVTGVLPRLTRARARVTNKPRATITDQTRATSKTKVYQD